VKWRAMSEDLYALLGTGTVARVPFVSDFSIEHGCLDRFFAEDVASDATIRNLSHTRIGRTFRGERLPRNY